MTSRLPLLAVLLTFAGSLAGFHLTTATAEPVAVTPRAALHPAADMAPSDPATPGDDCPKVGRLWEEA